MNKHEAHIPHGSPGPQEPDTIIIHCMGEFIDNGHGGYDHAVNFLADTVKLSAHSLIAPDGTNFRCREDTEGAWHARGFNHNSLGLEFLVIGDHHYASFIDKIKTPYLTKLQYSEGVAQVREWLTRHNIKRVVRHSDISPGRKVDPGAGFPWRKFLVDIGWEDDRDA